MINPKAITGFQLYGSLDPDTKVWTDGVLPDIMRQCENKASQPERRWIIFDGPVDAVWIENMNTVLDDNKVLCLTNGQKIKVTQKMNLIFEVEDLENASPATVSRCGMVYLESQQLSWQPLLNSYLKYKLKGWLANFRELIQINFSWLAQPIIAFVE